MRKLALLIFASVALASWSMGWSGPSDDTDAFFMGLGDLPGGNSNSAALGVSGDGPVVVGYSFTASGSEAFRWTTNAGMQAGELVRQHEQCGNCCVGGRFGRRGLDSLQFRARGIPLDAKFRDGLPERTARRYYCGEGFGISADGSVIVGRAEVASREEAFCWTRDQGMVGLGILPGGSYNTVATNVSADGSVVAGWAQSVPRAGTDMSFRWTRDEGMVGLGVLPGDVASRANGLSADGSVVVGQSEAGRGGGEAFRWTQNTGMVGLGVLPGGSRNSVATGVSADGSVIVGSSHGESGLEAFVWDATHGMRSVRDVLVNDLGLGKKLTGWKLTMAYAVSADGSTVVGCGTNPRGNMEAWIASIKGTPIHKPSALVSASCGLTVLMLTMQRQRRGPILPDARQCENKH